MGDAGGEVVVVVVADDLPEGVDVEDRVGGQSVGSPGSIVRDADVLCDVALVKLFQYR